MKQVILALLVLLILLGSMGLRWWALRRRPPEERFGDAERLERWVRHVTRGGDDF